MRARNHGNRQRNVLVTRLDPALDSRPELEGASRDLAKVPSGLAPVVTIFRSLYAQSRTRYLLDQCDEIERRAKARCAVK